MIRLRTASEVHSSGCLGIVVALLLITGCASVPLDVPKTPSYAIDPSSPLLKAPTPDGWLGGRTDINGFYPLINGFDAFGARLALMDSARATIDAQYFLMKPDNAGLVFAGKLMQAADRGVKVRLLLDDVFTTVDDVDLAMLDQHPNIELRIFNPISRSGFYWLNYLGRFSLANRRMHNKSFTVDNQISIVGGRNIAVEYFQLESKSNFIDFDMLSAGPVVTEVSRQFDRYWNHELAIPMAVLFDDVNKHKADEARELITEEMAEAGETIYGDAINTELMQQFYAKSLPPYIAEGRLITDDPDKLLVKVSREQQAVARDMGEALAAAKKEVIIFTPYLIPGKGGVKAIEELIARGVKIVVVTNSLATNNHAPVYSAYSRYRKDLLLAGVELWEARADAARAEPESEEDAGGDGILTLHTKAILIDGKQIFAGSLNLDPRSIAINTEMGLLIESSVLVEELRERSLRSLPTWAYRVSLDENGDTVWKAEIGGQQVVETHAPQTTLWQRFTALMLRVAPESQL